MKTRTLAILAGTALTASLVTTLTLAQGGPGYGRMQGGMAQPQARIVERFQLADTDKDGFVSRSEAEKALPGMALRFDALDTNQDGKLSSEELQAMRNIAQGSMRPAQAGQGMGMGMGMGMGPGRGMGRGGMQMTGGRAQGAGQGCLQADADKDGFVSRDEALRMGPRLQQGFDGLDADHDGKLSRQELQAHCPAMKL